MAHGPMGCSAIVLIRHKTKPNVVVVFTLYCKISSAVHRIKFQRIYILLCMSMMKLLVEMIRSDPFKNSFNNMIMLRYFNFLYSFQNLSIV